MLLAYFRQSAAHAVINVYDMFRTSQFHRMERHNIMR